MRCVAPGLGGPGLGGDVETMRRIFLAHVRGDRSRAALAEAAEAATSSRACLLCFERDPGHCHRTLVAGLICERTARPLLHLHPNGRNSFQ
jgi:uncharacterized protein (DUF488 family)